MAPLLDLFSNRTQALGEFAQPIIIAMSTAGLTGGLMAAAGLLAGRAVRRS